MLLINTKCTVHNLSSRKSTQVIDDLVQLMWALLLSRWQIVMTSVSSDRWTLNQDICLQQDYKREYRHQFRQRNEVQWTWSSQLQRASLVLNEVMLGTVINLKPKHLSKIFCHYLPVHRGKVSMIHHHTSHRPCMEDKCQGREVRLL